MPADRIIRSNRKTLAIEIRPDGEVWARAPMQMPEALIDQFLTAKSDWIQRKRQLARQRSQPSPLESGIDANGVYYLGELFPMQPAPRARSAQIHGKTIRIPAGSPDEMRSYLQLFYRREAQKTLPAILTLLASRHGFSPSKVRISSARKRWGSCSSNGTISLSWRLMMVPLPLIEYVILHELTHLRIHNHSKKFWQSLHALQPDMAARREQLRLLEKQLTF